MSYLLRPVVMIVKMLSNGSYLVKTMSGFKIAHINIQSFLPKFDELLGLLHNMSLDVLCLTESQMRM